MPTSVERSWAPVTRGNYHNPASKIRFITSTWDLMIKLGDGPILTTDGFGGWVEVERPKNKPMSRWEGAPLLKLKIPLLFDRRQEGEPIANVISWVYELGREEGGTEEPEVFRLRGHFMFSKRRWVLLDTPEVTNIMRDSKGKLIRQEMTITVMEYVPLDRLQFVKLPKKKKKPKTMKAKQGDTINKIARRLWSKKGKKKMRQLAAKMAKMNNIRDRNKTLKKGKVLKVPAS